jgi:hypothetical protein
VGQSERAHMMLSIYRGLEASVAGVVLLLIVAKFLSPGWTNTIYTRNLYSSQTSTSRVHAMAAVDVAPLIVVYVTVPNKETGTILSSYIYLPNLNWSKF